MITLAEQLKQEGRQEGETKKTREVVITAHKNGITISLIANIAGISEEEVVQILKEEGLM